MSLINSCVFECSMGHCISRMDAQFHMHTSISQAYPSNQQVGMHHLSSLVELMAFSVVGGPSNDEQWMVPPLGARGDH